MYVILEPVVYLILLPFYLLIKVVVWVILKGLPVLFFLLKHLVKLCYRLGVWAYGQIEIASRWVWNKGRSLNRG